MNAELREFRAGLAEPTPEAMARMRARIRTGRATRRWMSPAIAVAAVLAVGGGTAAVITSGSGGSTDRTPPVSRTEAPSSARNTSSAADPPSPAEHRAAVDLLERFAAMPGPEPLVVPAGKVLYARFAGSGSLRESWFDVNGGIELMFRQTEGGKVVGEERLDQQAAAMRAELASTGPSLRVPTPAYLAGLPTDPDVLYRMLRDAARRGDPWSLDRMTLQLTNFELLRRVEPLLIPPVRAAVYRALSKLDSIGSTGQPMTIDGREVYAIGQTERGQRMEIFLDARTGRIVGNGLTFGRNRMVTYSVVAKVGATR